MSRTTCPTLTLAGIALLLASAGCNNESLGPQIGTSSITVAPSTATIGRGQTLQLTAKIVDEFGDPLQRAVTWSSSDPSVATVSVGGTVFGQGPGRAAITANADGRMQASAVHVTEEEPQSKPKPLL